MIAAAALTVALGAAGAAHAGPASDAFGKCLVESSTGKDRIVFVQWFFAALSTHPNVSAIASVTPEQRAAYTRQAATVMDRLVLVDCHAEAVAAVQQDGPESMNESFRLFGQAAAGELLSNPAVNKEMSALGAYVDNAKWGELMDKAKK
ncbi:hypothetical protein [Caulobacter sp. 17J80-11]|uniref:hypothetical protein n=1 Tax=Caulobacter sp. 17J80-11 TaxID=2763502 RepID=UPI00165383A1|nr:hypothetical protein [Caulobacter sp. 17J80-11]MBC6983583.1 hypothetical protein [Caulobacter sp. 17J80-11]